MAEEEEVPKLREEKSELEEAFRKQEVDYKLKGLEYQANDNKFRKLKEKLQNKGWNEEMGLKNNA